MFLINGTSGVNYPNNDGITGAAGSAGSNQTGQGQGTDFSNVLIDSINEQIMQSLMNQLNGGTNSMFDGLGGLGGGTNVMLGGMGGFGGINALTGSFMPSITSGMENTLISSAESGQMSGAQLMLFMMIMMMQSSDNSGDMMPIMQMMVGMLSKYSGDVATGRPNNMIMPIQQQQQQEEPSGDIKRMVDIALEQVGYRERNADGSFGNGNRTKFGAWYGMDGQPWCAMFVSWAADQAGIINDVVPKHASTNAGANAYRERGLYAPQDSGYIPREGDAIYFYSQSKGRIGHVGIVVAYDPETRRVYTVEGNTDNAVRIRHYDIDNPRIDGYGRNGGTSFGTVPNTSSSGTGANTI